MHSARMGFKLELRQRFAVLTGPLSNMRSTCRVPVSGMGRNTREIPFRLGEPAKRPDNRDPSYLDVDDGELDLGPQARM